ncbi:MAG TPA: PepSY-like domain-containing protein [Chitinophagaceae bacterium]|nr:PepSY-like domain-containing protein [Chitinophagaceae bacterium]
MRLRNVIAIITVTVFAAACGNNSTKDSTGNDTLPGDNTAINTNVSPTTQTVIVPEPTQSSFKTKYPTATNVTWNRYEPVSTIDWEWSGWPVMDTADYVAQFNWDGTDYWAWYDENNNWIGTVSTMSDYAGLPAAVNDAVKKNFDGYTITSVSKENDKNRTAYEIKLSKGDDKAVALIGEDGKVWKKKMNTDGVKTKEKENPKKDN